MEGVAGLMRSRELVDDSIFCGVTIRTARGIAHIGAYLTDIDDAGVSLLRSDQLHESISSFEIDGGS